ncbi:hypothetical protein PINS_up021714 [Pythium insidiosum]|nr:hypothetical protein PINS_up021714 [Pythium insidiosum]
MAALSSNANVQHNLSVLQSQLLALQHENAALTREMAIKDQHVALREQQLRVMQQRMADAESALATWKDKYLEQLHLVRALQAGATTHDSGIPTRASADPATSREAAQWQPMPRPAAPSPSPPTGDLLASVIEQLSPSDREKLQALLATARPEASVDAENAPASAWEQVFEEAPRELLQLLHCYLLPTLESAAQGEQKATAHRTFRCLTRTFHRVVTDVLVVCDVAESADHAGIAVASSPTECSIDSETLASPVSSASLSEFQEPRTSNDDSPLDEAKPQPSNPAAAASL